MWHVVGSNALSIVCVASGTALALYDKEGWGWLFLIAVCVAAVPATPCECVDEDDPDGAKDMAPIDSSETVTTLRRTGTK